MIRLIGFSYVGRIENLRDLVYYKLYGKDNFWFPFEVSDMVKNNIELDVKTKCIEQGKTQVNLAEEIETTKAYVNRVIKKQDGVVNQTFVKMMEALGYDIELRYVERKSYMSVHSRLCKDNGKVECYAWRMVLKKIQR